MPKPTNHQERIQFDSTLLSIITDLSEGNPGAATVLGKFLSEHQKIDPVCPSPLLGLLGFDSLGIYGPNIWILYKDCCNQRIGGVIAVLRHWQMGITPEETIWNWIDSSTPLDVDQLILDLRKQLPEFYPTLDPVITTTE